MLIVVAICITCNCLFANQDNLKLASQSETIQSKQLVNTKDAIDSDIGYNFKINDKLNPLLFNGDKLKPEIREALLKIARRFLKEVDIDLEPADIYLVGSNVNYNYTNKSDIDLHFFYEYKNNEALAKILAKYLPTKCKIFNSKYNIYIKGIHVEVFVEDANSKVVAGGIYSLVKDDWNKKPELTQIPEVSEELSPYMNKFINEIEKTIETHDSKKIKNLQNSLHKMRRESLEKDGEFGSGNLIYKNLRAKGYLKKLKQAYYDSVSKELSLN